MMWLIGIGGALGAGSRYMAGSIISKRIKSSFPLATLLINIAGSLFLGMLTSLHLNHQLMDWIWYLTGIGFCGAFTTFSTFGYEVIQLLNAKKLKDAVIYILGSLFICTFSSYIGILLFN
ncbi:fluoride efflux transporter CrcB [Fredinandcohnia quinoae]|uniref:Fluoride-specific ion channel FluC n=1 Tax=Fredinandcohnia quinoae TaxID=2918902 RepID=A0AAW5ECM5_9BACI|nr:fluoride efflux transporter CrcB [Fredinandcohnia sp. SECRCQ15]MCH1627652.1 fluoride efflux transporter CrcB [Fredinandcohnia sp. SECRCQ15]